MRDFIILAVILGLAPICFFRPYVGVLVWSWISYFNPHRFAWGVAYNFPVALVIAVPTLVGAVIFGRFNRKVFTRETILLLLLWIWFGVTLLHASQNPILDGHVAVGAARLYAISKILLMTFLTMLLVNSRQKLKYLFLLTAFSFGALAFKGALFGVRTQGAFRVWGPQDTFVGDNNAFALAVNMALPMLFFLAREMEKRWMRLVLWGTFACCVLSVLLTYSRGGFLGLVVVLSLIALKSKQKFLCGVLMVITVVAVLAFAPSHWMSRMSQFLGGQLDTSAQQRIDAWGFAWTLAKTYPLTGGGFETFTPELYQRYAPNALAATGPHSIYFQVLGEHGFVGLGLYLLLLGSCWSTLRGLRRRVRRVPSAHWVMTYSHMMEVSLMAFMISGAFLEFANFDLFYQLVASTVVLRVLARQEVLASIERPAMAPSFLLAREQTAS